MPIKSFVKPSKPAAQVGNRINLKVKCDNCGKDWPRNMRPPFISFWKCPECRTKEQSFFGQTSNQANPNQIDNMMSKAEGLYPTASTKADQLVDEIFQQIFKS